MVAFHRFVPGASPSAATILLLHETGADENDLVPIGRALAPGMSFLSPRLAPETTAGDVAAWVDSVGARVYVLSYASGATLAAEIILFHPGTVTGGILLRPDMVAEPDRMPDLQGAPILMLGGDQRLAQLLARAGAAVDVALPGAELQLTPQDFAMGKKWFQRQF